MCGGDPSRGADGWPADAPPSAAQVAGDGDGDGDGGYVGPSDTDREEMSMQRVMAPLVSMAGMVLTVWLVCHLRIQRKRRQMIRV